MLRRRVRSRGRGGGVMDSCANRIGLALSGGGFRASLYHLGLVRFLRDGGILPQVTHITSVSGGSIFAAHLVLNWDRYNGSPGEFDAAASEFLSFMRLDVRNRIARRFPPGAPAPRAAPAAGALESQADAHRAAGIPLREVSLRGHQPVRAARETPQLHLLATNLSEGCLCSFNRDGLLMVRRQPGNTFRIDRVHIGLATVPMAVTASSAFPGFFPPLELTGADVGAGDGEFGRQAYTDGGVFDNLGVRMFRCLERPLLAESPLSRDDFFDFQAFVESLREASKSSEETPLRRLAQILVVERSRPNQLMLTDAGTSGGAGSQTVAVPGPAGSPAPIDSLSGCRRRRRRRVVRPVGPHAPLSVPPRAALRRPEARRPRRGSAPRVPAVKAAGSWMRGDQLWLNRHLLEAAFRQATGHACFRRLNSGLDGVLVSDVGKPIEVQGNRRAGGLIRTALRATDILMDRVWQLENETFQDTPGFVFAPITEVVEPAEDPTALHPEIQRQAAHIRTDLDRFSPLEISSLVRHGYCVGRKACRARPDLFGAELPDDAPWDPIPGPPHTAPEIPAAARPSHRLRSPQLGGRLGAGMSRPRPRSRRGRCKPRPSGASGAPCWTPGTGPPTSTCRCWSRSSSCCPTSSSSPTSGPSGSASSWSRSPRAAGIWTR